MNTYSISQFVGSAASILASTWLGKWLDSKDRRIGALTIVTVNKLALAGAALTLFVLLLISNGRFSVYLNEKFSKKSVLYF